MTAELVVGTGMKITCSRDDLASSLGHTGDVDHPEVRAAITTVRQACVDVGLPTGILGLNAAALAPHIADGFTLLIAGLDVLMLGEAAKEMLAAVRRT